jgi:5-methylcytosine-specific restriction endonuclease McrA
MRAPDDPYPAVLRHVIAARLRGDDEEAARAIAEIRFEPAPRRTEKWPTRTVIAQVYRRDFYHCRYCGEKVILTPVMRLVSRLYPGEFPYHPNWKSDATHPAFVSRSATLDHVVPIADGGDPLDPANLVTACWGCNRRKGDLRLEEIGWALVEPADHEWHGLEELFNPLWETVGRPQLSEDETWWLKATASRLPRPRDTARPGPPRHTGP